jgi:hypothetical protein
LFLTIELLLFENAPPISIPATRCDKAIGPWAMAHFVRNVAQESQALLVTHPLSSCSRMGSWEKRMPIAFGRSDYRAINNFVLG